MNNYIPPILLTIPEIATNYAEKNGDLWSSIKIEESNELDNIVDEMIGFVLYSGMANREYQSVQGQGAGKCFGNNIQEIYGCGCYIGIRLYIDSLLVNGEGEALGYLNPADHIGYCWHDYE